MKAHRRIHGTLHTCILPKHQPLVDSSNWPFRFKLMSNINNSHMIHENHEKLPCGTCPLTVAISNKLHKYIALQAITPCAEEGLANAFMIISWEQLSLGLKVNVCR